MEDTTIVKMVYLIISYYIAQGEGKEMMCFKSMVQVPEINLGASPLFPWMGILQVHLQEITNLRLATTSLVLIRNHYALAVASDIEKIPKRILREESQVMFVIEQGAYWYCKVKDYITHPEYDMKTFTTIAVVELETFNGEPFKPKAICWPEKYYLYKRTDELYAFEFIDDRIKLEKKIRKLKYAETKECDEFYNRFEMRDLGAPASYQCAYAVHSKSFCIWENGVVIASNNTGHWVIVGLGVQGPGCAAPGRFISLALYLPWIKLFTTIEDKAEEPRLPYLRRSAFGTGFKAVIPTETPFEVIPIHNLPSKVQPSRRWYYDATMKGFGRLPDPERRFRPWSFYDKYLDKDVTIKQESPVQLKLNLFTAQSHADSFTDPCRNKEDLMFNEDISFSIYEDFHGIEYWISVYNTYVSNNYTCILITVLSEGNRFANLSVIDWLVLSADEEQLPPLKILEKHNNRTNPPLRTNDRLVKKMKDKKDYRKPLSEVELDFLDAPHKITTLNIKVSFQFLKSATLRVEVYGKNMSKPEPVKVPEKIVFPGNKGRGGAVLYMAIPDPLPQDPTDILRFFHKPAEGEPLKTEGEKVWMENDKNFFDKSCGASIKNKVVTVLVLVRVHMMLR